MNRLARLVLLLACFNGSMKNDSLSIILMDKLNQLKKEKDALKKALAVQNKKIKKQRKQAGPAILKKYIKKCMSLADKCPKEAIEMFQLEQRGKELSRVCAKVHHMKEDNEDKEESDILLSELMDHDPDELVTFISTKCGKAYGVDKKYSCICIMGDEYPDVTYRIWHK